jgi:general stress protein 26
MWMTDQAQASYDVEKFRDLIKDIPFAMFTTVTAHGGLRSRPMVATVDAFDGRLWFFTRTGSAVAQEISGNYQINVTYVSAPEDRFISVSGRALVSRDIERAGQLWSPSYNQWFAGGASDAELSMIAIDVARVEYWDRKAGRMQLL